MQPILTWWALLPRLDQEDGAALVSLLFAHSSFEQATFSLPKGIRVTVSAVNRGGSTSGSLGLHVWHYPISNILWFDPIFCSFQGKFCRKLLFIQNFAKFWSQKLKEKKKKKGKGEKKHILSFKKERNKAVIIFLVFFYKASSTMVLASTSYCL